jgi:oligopeptide transport system permease protein
MSELNKWINLGYIEYDYTAADAPSTFKITEKGQASGEVYVTEITGQTETISDKQGIIYTMTGTIIRYKKLGYKTMPIHLFGTEKDGKDMLKYVFSGLRTSLILGIIVAAINIIIGVIWGSISGYYGGTVDIVMERLTDILGGIPWIVLMTVLTLQLGQNFFVFALALCLTGWIGTSSTTRSQFYRYRGREYVLASRTLGARAPRLIFRHILPNAVGTIITRSILMIPGVIFSEATISYLGLGLQNLDSLGVILSDTQKNLSVYPNQLIIPAIIISMLMICFNLFGNGLRDAFNPSLKGQD